MIDNEWWNYEYAYFECQCQCDNHLLKLAKNTYYKEIDVCVQLNDYNHFFQRVWTGVKYILRIGSPPTHGHWHCTTLRPSDIQKMIGFLQTYQDDLTRSENKSDKKSE